MSYSMTYAPGGLAAADQVRSLGRNEDSQLVHMTPGEVQALQAMAEQHGGSLTINPHTGLPEAGFLSGLLSVAAPIALGFTGIPGMIGAGITGGAATGALEAGLGMGLITGGLTALSTGDIGKGLTSGLMSGALTGAMKSWNPTAASTPGAATTTPGTPTVALEALKNPAAYSQGINLSNATYDPFAGVGQNVGQAVTQGANVVTPTAYESMFQNPAVYKGAIEAAPAAANVVEPAYGNVAPGISLAGQSIPAAQAGTGLFDKLGNLTTGQKLAIGAGGLGLLGAMSKQPTLGNVTTDKGTIRPYAYQTGLRAPEAGRTQFVQPMYDAQGNPVLDTRERNYFNQSFTALPTYAAAGGGLMGIGSMDQNNMFPQSQQEHTNFATPTQMPTSAEVIDSDYDAKTNAYTGQEMPRMADGGDITSGFQGYGQDNQGGRNPLDLLKLLKDNQQPQQSGVTVIRQASGGLSDAQYNLGSYSDGGRLLKGPGDGVSDNIPAVIGQHQPARLADGEFVVPARIVSELGNGSTDAGARRLYDMMDRIQAGRKRSMGKGKVAVDSKAEKHLPA